MANKIPENPENSPRLDCSGDNFGIVSGGTSALMQRFYSFMPKLLRALWIRRQTKRPERFRGTQAYPKIIHESAGIKAHAEIFRATTRNFPGCNAGIAAPTNYAIMSEIFRCQNLPPFFSKSLRAFITARGSNTHLAQLIGKVYPHGARWHFGLIVSLW